MVPDSKQVTSELHRNRYDNTTEYVFIQGSCFFNSSAPVSGFTEVVSCVDRGNRARQSLCSDTRQPLSWAALCLFERNTISSASSQSYSDATNVNEKINVEKIDD